MRERQGQSGPVEAEEVETSDEHDLDLERGQDRKSVGGLPRLDVHQGKNEGRVVAYLVDRVAEAL